MGWIAVDGISHLDHITLVFDEVVKGLFIGHKLFQVLIGMFFLKLL